jgi:hypothetical protein
MSVRLRKGGKTGQLTVPVEMMRSLGDAAVNLEFEPEFTDDGILYRAVAVTTRRSVVGKKWRTACSANQYWITYEGVVEATTEKEATAEALADVDNGKIPIVEVEAIDNAGN